MASFLVAMGRAVAGRLALFVLWKGRLNREKVVQTSSESPDKRL